ncbi:MAG: transposase [Treponema sp.]|nr:transposase [Treponema sp.]
MSAARKNMNQVMSQEQKRLLGERSRIETMGEAYAVPANYAALT